MLRWRNDVPGISQASGPTKVGTTFVEEVHLFRTKQLLMKVTEYQPTERLVIEAQSGMPMPPTQTFFFASEGNAKRIDLSDVMKTSGFLTMMEFILPAN